MTHWTFKERARKNKDSVAVTYWKNLKALTVNPLEENKSFRASSLTEELHGGDRNTLLTKLIGNYAHYHKLYAFIENKTNNK